MTVRIQLVLLLLSSLLLLTSTDDVTYDYVVLALTWPPGYCTSIGNECARNKVTNTWTIHGLWPTINEQTSKPAFCDGDPFSLDNLSSDLKSELTVFWPSYRESATDASFWSYEWSKHGTCAVQGDPEMFPSQSAYFSRTLELYSRFNFGLILQDNDIYPGTSTSLSELKSTFTTFFGISNTVTFQCSTIDNHRYITSTHFCLSANFSVISCPSGKTDSCSNSNLLLYSSSGHRLAIDILLLLLLVVVQFVQWDCS